MVSLGAPVGDLQGLPIPASLSLHQTDTAVRFEILMMMRSVVYINNPQHRQFLDEISD